VGNLQAGGLLVQPVELLVKGEDMKWTPIFERDGREFIVPYASMVGDSEHEAFEIAMRTMLGEGVVMNFTVTNPLRYVELDDDGKVNVKGWNAELGPWDIVILDTTKETATT
jgi:hypothetical protein